MARTPRPRLMWTSGVLQTLRSSDQELRMRSGERVEVVGTTTDATGPVVIVSADVRVLRDGALLTVPAHLVAKVRTEEAPCVGADS